MQKVHQPGQEPLRWRFFLSIRRDGIMIRVAKFLIMVMTTVLALSVGAFGAVDCGQLARHQHDTPCWAS